MPIQTQTTTTTHTIEKNIVLAYVLWFFLGTLGVHRFYLGRINSGITFLALTIFGIIGSFIYVGFALIIAVWVWWIIDAFLIPSMVVTAPAGKNISFSTTTTTTTVIENNNSENDANK